MYPQVLGHKHHIAASSNEGFHAISRSRNAIPSFCSKKKADSQNIHTSTESFTKSKKLWLTSNAVQSGTSSQDPKKPRTKVTNPALSLPEGRSGLSQPIAPGLTGAIWARPKGGACTGCLVTCPYSRKR